MESHSKSDTRPGLGIPGAVGTSELTTDQYASGSGTAGTSDLTAVQHAIGSIDKCGGCNRRKDKCKGRKRTYEPDSAFRNYLMEKRMREGITEKLPDSGFACGACHRMYTRSESYERLSQVSTSTENIPLTDETIELSEDQYKELTGYTKQQISALTAKYITGSTLRTSSTRTKEIALTAYLTKLKKGLSNLSLATTLKMKQTNVKNCIKKIRDQLSETLVPQRIGLKNITRTVLEKHNSEMVRLLHCDANGSIAIILDGTYIYIQKSANNEFQRVTYSMHKNRHLIKPMVIICSDGYIIDIVGPYEANKNDAAILSDIMDKYRDVFNREFKAGDVFLVDRGFQNVVAKIEERGFIAKMPACIPSNQKVLTVAQANESRMVTKCRWKVEVINGKLKQFELLNKVRPNRALQTLKKDIKIAGALLNEFFHPIESDKADAPFIAARMKAQLNIDNALLRKVDEAGLDRKSKIFVKMDQNSCPEFPALSAQDLRNITLGTYQIRMAKSCQRTYGWYWNV
jgi:hypothetical protein